MSEEVAEFSYTYTPRVLLLLMSISALITSYGSYRAYGNHRELVIRKTFDLNAEVATRPYWLLAGLGCAAFVFFLAILLTRHLFPRHIVLEKKYFLAPTSRWPFSMYEQVVRYDAIQGFEMFTSLRMRTLRILHKNGMVEVDSIRFQSKTAFEDFCRKLDARTTAARIALGEALIDSISKRLSVR